MKWKLIGRIGNGKDDTAYKRDEKIFWNFSQVGQVFVFEFSIATSYGWIRMGGENKIPADSQWDVFGSLTHRPEQMGTAFWDGVNLAQIHIQSLQKIYL